MKSKIILMLLGLLLVLFAYSFSQVPQLINYQGKLTKSSGAPIDTTVAMIFSIYADSNGTILNWTETQGAVKVDKGVFNVLLGSVNPISSSVFNGSVRYLGVKVGGDPEITPRKPMVSVPYAYQAGSIQTNCHDCDSIFVNVAGPDSVYSSSGIAFLGKASGSSVSAMLGMYGYANNTSTGNALGGFFETSSSGTGAHVGVSGSAYGSSSSIIYGSSGWAGNTSTGMVYGGNFQTASEGTGTHYGVYGVGSGSSSSDVFGSYGNAYNYSTGRAYGGYFYSAPSGTGYHFGVYGYGVGYSSSPAYGCYGFGWNNSTGSAYGSYGFGYNSSTGTAYGGYFEAASSGTGTKYGVYATAPTSQGYAGYFVGKVRITDSLIVMGSKSAAVKVNNGDYRLLYCQESPENWFEDFGEGQLVNGRAQITLDPMFLQTVTIDNRQPLKVFITLTSGEPTNYVVNKGNAGFELVVSDKSSKATFDYRVVAKRKGYENLRLAKMGGPTPEEVALEQANHQAEMEKERAKMEKERLKQEEEEKQMSEQPVKIDEKIR